MNRFHPYNLMVNKKDSNTDEIDLWFGITVGNIEIAMHDNHFNYKS